MSPAFRHSEVAIEGSSLHVVESGDVDGPAFALLHGWPQSWHSWQPVMEIAPPSARLVAIDLPGVGGSTRDATDGSKRQVANLLHRVLATLELRDVTLVGHDIGGMVTYAYLRQFDDITAAVIMDIVVPGIAPWDAYLRLPNLWHFAMHAIPALPERLVHDRQRDYFDYFYDLLASDPSKITEAARTEYVDAYAAESALTAGFNWFRAFERDAADNREAGSVTTPLLYLRGEHERGGIPLDAYGEGFRAAGVAEVVTAIVPGSGHFAPEEAPAETWQLIAEFAAGVG